MQIGVQIVGHEPVLNTFLGCPMVAQVDTLPDDSFLLPSKSLVTNGGSLRQGIYRTTWQSRSSWAWDRLGTCEGPPWSLQRQSPRQCDLPFQKKGFQVVPSLPGPSGTDQRGSIGPEPPTASRLFSLPFVAEVAYE
jgi:hypothetical protein